MRYKMLLFGAKLDTNHPFVLAGDFFGNLADVDIVYYHMLQKGKFLDIPGSFWCS